MKTLFAIAWAALVSGARGYLYGSQPVLDSPFNSIYTAKSLHCTVEPETYQRNGQKMDLYGINDPYANKADIRLDDGPVTSMTLILYGIQDITFSIKFDRVTGWISHNVVSDISSSSVGGDVSAMLKIRQVVGAARQILITQNAVTFIADAGTTRLGFSCSRTDGINGPTVPILTQGPAIYNPVFNPIGQNIRDGLLLENSPLLYGQPVYRRLQQAETRTVDASSYVANGSPAPLFPGGPLSVTLVTERDPSGPIKVLLTVKNHYNYRVFLSDAVNGYVSRSQFIDKSYLTASVDESVVEQKLQNILEGLSQIVFGPGGGVTLYADNGQTHITFGGSGPSPPQPTVAPTAAPATQSTYDVVAQTYMVNGQYATLFTGASQPAVTLILRKPSPGNLGVQLECGNTLAYAIRYTPANGMVSGVDLISETHTSSDSAALDVQQKLTNIIARVQQLGFESGGRVQFITDASSTRISFDPRRFTHQ